MMTLLADLMSECSDLLMLGGLNFLNSEVFLNRVNRLDTGILFLGE
jgi:hypothetical protein